ncbi:hypothetical protein LI328DRAFT_157178 [Trichoderma asperelloides]|nr:hypothetical protein LI328DRAFT_157178 [Trichoderma asperelloides]
MASRVAIGPQFGSHPSLQMGQGREFVAAFSEQRSQSTAQIVFPVSTSRLLIMDASSSCPTSLKQGLARGACLCPRSGLGPRARRFTTAGRPGSQSLLIKSILAGRRTSGTRTGRTWPWKGFPGVQSRASLVASPPLVFVVSGQCRFKGPMRASAAKINTGSLSPSPSCLMRYRREPHWAKHSVLTCAARRSNAADGRSVSECAIDAML